MAMSYSQRVSIVQWDNSRPNLFVQNIAASPPTIEPGCIARFPSKYALGRHSPQLIVGKPM